MAKRVGKSDCDHEHHLCEGAVVVAHAMHLLRLENVCKASIHAYGQHKQQFDFGGWLRRRNFTMVSSCGSTTYGGTYRNFAGQTVTVFPKSGLGDIVAYLGDHIPTAELKRGVISTLVNCRGSVAAIARVSDS